MSLTPKEGLTTEEDFRPNIILFTVDDMGWNDIGYSDHSDVPEATPFMNELVKKSVKLTHYYTQPSCTPSRATIMSGKWAHKIGYQNVEVQYNSPLGMPLSIKLMPQHMKEQGYRTVGFGKWNIGHCSERYLPHTRGFDYFLGYNCPGHGYRNFNCGSDSGIRDLFEAGVKTVDGQEQYYWQPAKSYLGSYDTEVYTKEGVKFINEHFTNHADKRFFMWMAHHGLHGFMDSNPHPSEQMISSTSAKYLKVLRKRAANDELFAPRLVTAAIAMAVDYSLYRLCETLRDHDALMETMIVVHSDNGADPDYTLGHPGNNYPLRGEKFFYFEGGIRVPAFVYAPKLIHSDLIGTEYKGMMHHVDLLTTFVKVAGGDAKEDDEHLDGEDFLAAINEGRDTRQELVLSLPRSGTHWKFGEETNEVAVIRMGKFKMMITSPSDYIFLPGIKEEGQKFIVEFCSYGWYAIEDGQNTVSCGWDNFLFDVENDPTETVNLWEDEAMKPIKEEMIKRVHALLIENPYEYGRLQYENYEHNDRDGGNNLMLATLRGRDDWLGPWGCYVLN